MIGMPDYGFRERTFNELKLVYIGTLVNREIWQSIEGLKIFIKKYPNIKISYDIIGSGKQLEIQKIKNSIDNNELNNNKVDYYFSRVGNLNLTNYRPIKQVGDFILYERVK